MTRSTPLNDLKKISYEFHPAKIMRSFLNWAGGKTRLIRRLLPYVPPDHEQRAYWEPFLGSGAMYFALLPKKAVLADLNPDLINCYRAIRKEPEKIADLLDQFSDSHSPPFYISARSLYNKTNDKILKAALFVYLNKASFNAIYRVNKRGEFNVPCAHKSILALPTIVQLTEISNVLKKAKLVKGTFEETLKDATKGDFVYLDPPYPPINGTSFFTHYTKEKFGLDDQGKVRMVANSLKKKGCLVMISNTDLPFIRALYQGWNIHSLPVTRWLTCKSVKQKVTDLIITSYDLERI
jgi:DNA adenine methylase